MDIQFILSALVVVPGELHQVVGTFQLRVDGLHRIPFCHHEGLALVGIETPPVHPHGGVTELTHRRGCINLIPVGVAQIPEARPPTVIQSLNGAVLLP